VSLEKEFSNELKILFSLFGRQTVEEKLPRLNDIYSESERLWHIQLDMIPERKVRYLLIAEAPPWSEIGDIVYVYNPKSDPRTLLKAVTKAFFGRLVYNTIGVEKTLKLLAQQGFLIIDSIPFAMAYSEKSKRQRSNYRKLLQATSDSYLLKILNNSGILWGKNLKTAFGFTINGKTIIDKFRGRIPIESSIEIIVDSNSISADRSGFPNANRLKEIYGL